MSTPRLDPPARVLVTKIGLDGHDRGSRIVAAFLRDAGMDVIYTPPWQSIPAVVKLAMEEDVDAIGVSSLATDHLIVPQLIQALRAAGLGHVAVVVGGIVPDDERPALIAVGRQRRPRPRRLARRDRRPRRRARRRSARGARRRTAGVDIMTKEAVQLPLPGFDQAFGQWRADYASQIGADRKVVNRSGIEVRPLYTPRDWDGSAYETDLGFPGQYPFTRGIYPTMHRGRTWTQRQLIGLGTPEDYNARVRQLLAAGATAISFLPCNSGFRGVDCDEVDPALLGTCGTVSNTVDDMDVALAGVPLGEISTAMNDPSPFTLLAFTLGVASAAASPGRPSPAHPTRATIFRISSPTICSTACRSGLAPGADRSRRVLPGARAELESHFGGRPAHAAGGRDPGRDGRLHLLHGAAIRRRLRRARHRHRRPAAPLHLLLRHFDQLLRGDRQSSAPRGGSGRASRASASARRTRTPGASSSTARPRGST